MNSVPIRKLSDLTSALAQNHATSLPLGLLNSGEKFWRLDNSDFRCLYTSASR